MDDNKILKLSNKKNKRRHSSRQLKSEQKSKNIIQTQLFESQRINLKENSPSEINPQLIQTNNPSSPQPKQNLKEIIYDNKYVKPDIESVNANDLGKSNVEGGEASDDKMLENLGAYPAMVKCPYCNTHIKSNVIYNCNCFTIFVLIIMIIIFPLICIATIYNAGTKKKCFKCKEGNRCGICDCCNDAQHICPNCHKVIGESYSCERLFSCL